MTDGDHRARVRLKEGQRRSYICIMPDTPPIHGTCDPRFAPVRDAFADNFRVRGELGAAVAVVVDGRPVVDLWGGSADLGRTRPWQRDTIVNVYSCTKAMAALCLLRLVDVGRVDLDAPVVRYWPEFGRQGKEGIPVRWLLSHRAGLAAVRRLLPDEALYDWDAMTAALAAETPWWEPGTAHGYHAVTFGWLVGEIVRRVTGEGFGRHFRETVARPLGLDFHVGLPDREHARVAEMSEIAPPDGDGASLAALVLSDPEGLQARAFVNPPSMARGVNVPEWRRAEIPGANGHGSARDLAALYGALASGRPRLLSADGVARCATEESVGPDLVLGVPTRFGPGFMLSQDHADARFGPSPRAFGHPGAGGSLGFADPDARLGFGYVLNRMGPRILLDPRAVGLIGAVYAALGARSE
jgi:CubicO group peptidase (beta-lactamase class C family)